MRRKDRELNIFSMSALDLFASALGAFILITLILLPYYLQEGAAAEPPPQECPTPEPAPVCPPVAPVPVCPDPVPAPVCPVCPAPVPVPECPPPAPPQKVVTDNLLVVQMTWSESEDVDLHVQTPDGEFYYGRKVISGRPGKFIIDNTGGGTNAVEIWLAHNPTPGLHKVCFRLYSNRSSRGAQVGGVLDKPSGRVVIPARRLNPGSGKICVLEFEISPDYSYRQLSP